MARHRRRRRRGNRAAGQNPQPPVPQAAAPQGPQPINNHDTDDDTIAIDDSVTTGVLVELNGHVYADDGEPVPWTWVERREQQTLALIPYQEVTPSLGLNMCIWFQSMVGKWYSYRRAQFEQALARTTRVLSNIITRYLNVMARIRCLAPATLSHPCRRFAIPTNEIRGPEIMMDGEWKPEEVDSVTFREVTAPVDLVFPVPTRPSQVPDPTHLDEFVKKLPVGLYDGPIRRTDSTWWRDVASWMVMPKDVSRRQNIVAEFRKIEHHKVHPRQFRDHPHANAAAFRSNEKNGILDFIKRIGGKPYFVSMSQREQDGKLRGSRALHSLKDLNKSYQRDLVRPNDVLVLYDVQRLDVLERLLDGIHLVIGHFHTPKVPAFRNKNVEYSFARNGKLVTRITGNAEAYVDDLIDFRTEFIVKRGYGFAYYQAEYQFVSEHQQTLALFIPRGSWSWPKSWIVYNLIGCPPSLSTHNPVCRLKGTSKPSPYVMMVDRTSNPTTVSIAKVDEVGGGGLFTLTLQEFHTCAAILMDSKTGPGSVHRYIKSISESSVPYAAVFWTDFFRTCDPNFHGIELPETATLNPRIVHYTFGNNGMGTLTLRSFMAPLRRGAASPTDHPANTDQAIKARATEIQLPVPPTKDTIRVAEMLVEFLVPESKRGSIRPVDYAQVFAKQARPSQQAILQRILTSPFFDAVFEVFIKRESYNKINDPRMIAVIRDLAKLNESAAIYAVFMYFLENPGKFDWCAFGKTPRGIAEKIASTLHKFDYVIGTDFSRMDGRMSEAARVVESRLLRRLFTDDTWPEVQAAYESTLHRRGFTKWKQSFKAFFARLSGVPDTALFNSLVTLYIAYMAYDSLGIPKEEILQYIVAIGGDDGLIGVPKGMDVDVVRRAFEGAAASVGQFVTSQIYERGSVVKFFGRLYSPGVWDRLPDSMADIQRQLNKLHTTVSPKSVEDKHVAYQKALGWVYSDANTPILGSWATRVVQLSRIEETSVIGIENRSYNSLVFSSEEQYPNEPGAWMLPVVYAELETNPLVVSYLESKIAKADNVVQLLHLCEDGKPIFGDPIDLKPGVTTNTGYEPKETSGEKKTRRGGRGGKGKKRRDGSA